MNLSVHFKLPHSHEWPSARYNQIYHAGEEVRGNTFPWGFRAIMWVIPAHSGESQVRYPNRNWREVDEVPDGTVGVCDPHNVGLVDIDGLYCGMFNNVTQNRSWCHRMEGPLFCPDPSFRGCFFLVESSDSTHILEPRIHKASGRRFCRRNK